MYWNVPSHHLTDDTLHKLKCENSISVFMKYNDKYAQVYFSIHSCISKRS